MENNNKALMKKSSMSSSLFNTWANQLCVAKTDAVYKHAGRNEEDNMKNGSVFSKRSHNFQSNSL